MNKRLFLAITLPASTMEQLTQTYEVLHNASLRLTQPDNLHITVAYLGYVDEDKIKRIERAVEKATEDLPPFSLTPEGLAFGPHIPSPRFIWVKYKDSPFFSELVDRVAKSLETAGFRSQGMRWKNPHITIARFRDKVQQSTLPILSLPSLQVRAIMLFESKLQRSGPKYRLQKMFKLKKSA